MMQGQIVKRVAIRGFRQRKPESAPAALLTKLLDLKTDEAYTHVARSLNEGAHLRSRLSKLAEKEGYTLGWDRNESGTELYLWLERAAS